MQKVVGFRPPDVQRMRYGKQLHKYAQVIEANELGQISVRSA